MRAALDHGGVRIHDLTELHDLLEPPKVARDLDRGLLAQQPGDRRREAAAGHRVVQVYPDLGPALRRRHELHAAGVGHVSLVEGPPGDQLVGAVLDDLRVPLDGGARRGAGLPV